LLCNQVRYGTHIRLTPDRRLNLLRPIPIAGSISRPTESIGNYGYSMVEWWHRLGRMADSMSLNIKNKEAHKLANQLAKLTGENLTEAVTKAVRERLDRLRSQRGSGLADLLVRIIRLSWFADRKGSFKCGAQSLPWLTRQ
jgi:hypothetical protein